MKRLRVSLLTPGGGLTPATKFARTHLYTWVVSGTVRVKCFDQEHDAISPTRAWTRTAWSGDKRTKYEATGTPTTTPNGISAQKNCFLTVWVTWGAYGIHIFNSVISKFSDFCSEEILDFATMLMLKSFKFVESAYSLWNWLYHGQFFGCPCSSGNNYWHLICFKCNNFFIC